MLSGVSRTMELCLIINKSNKTKWHLHCLTGFFALRNAVCLPEGFSSTGFRRCQDSRSYMFALHVSMQTSVPTATWFTRRYDSFHVCIPAASREAVHVRGNNEVFLKNRPASFIFLSFCLLHDLLGVASTNVCPCCCASCSPLPSSPTCWFSSVKQFPALFFLGWGSKTCTVQAYGLI